MSESITKFDGEYRFLSNFYLCTIYYESMRFHSTEAAFQAAKTTDYELRKVFCEYSPGKAKREGRKLKIRPDWQKVRLDVMYLLCQQKFSKEPLKQMLLDTGDRELIEGNHWYDTFWGVCNGVGENNLGKILMRIRKELKEKHSQ